MWLHSSVGRATHRQRVGHRFESRWSPDFFQASSFQLLIGKFTAMIILHFYNHSVVDVVNIMLFFSKVLVSIFLFFRSNHEQVEKLQQEHDALDTEIKYVLKQATKFIPRHIVYLIYLLSLILLSLLLNMSLLVMPTLVTLNYANCWRRCRLNWVKLR